MLSLTIKSLSTSDIYFPEVSFFSQLLSSGINNKVTVLTNILSKATIAVMGRKGRNNKTENHI